MRVFKYLVALADIAVGFLGFFFIIFAIAQPTLTDSRAENAALAAKVRALQEHLRQLTEIDLSETGSGATLETEKAAEIIIGKTAIRVIYQQQTGRFANLAAFLRQNAKMKWPPQVVLFVDRSAPFDRVVQIIEALRQQNSKITVKIAALAKKETSK
jgi:biopolymer transport protein ExbD